MKIDDILKITPEEAKKMTTKELYDVVWDLSRSVNKMRANLIKNDFKPLSLIGLENEGYKGVGMLRAHTYDDPVLESPGRMSVMKLDVHGKSTGVPKTRNELLHEFTRGINFYTSSDSSISKQKTLMKEFEKTHNIKFKNVYEYRDFWRAVDKARTIAATEAIEYDYNQAIDSAIETLTENKVISASDIIETLNKIQREEFEKREAKIRMYTDKGTSALFNPDDLDL